MSELKQIVEESSLSQEVSTSILTPFQSFLDQVNEWEEKALSIVIEDESQKQLMKDAGVARKALKNIRVSCDKKRKEMKADALAYGKAVQGVYNFIESKIKPLESHLEEQEKFMQIQEQKRIDELRQKRTSECSELSEFIPMNIDLGVMEEADYQTLLNGARLQKKQQEEELAREREEAERKERERKEQEEKLRLENERLKKEAEEARLIAEKERLEREAKEAEERAKAEKVRKEEERKRIQAEERARVEAEERAKAEAIIRQKEAEERAKAEAERIEREKLLAAPDNAKIQDYINRLRSVEVPAIHNQIKLMQSLMDSLNSVFEGVEITLNK